jgi:hypothetical protein
LSSKIAEPASAGFFLAKSTNYRVEVVRVRTSFV